MEPARPKAVAVCSALRPIALDAAAAAPGHRFVCTDYTQGKVSLVAADGTNDPGDLAALLRPVRDGLFDRRVRKLCNQIPESVPSGMPLQLFEGCE